MSESDATGSKHNRKRTRYPTDLTNAGWAMVSLLILLFLPVGQPRTSASGFFEEVAGKKQGRTFGYNAYLKIFGEDTDLLPTTKYTEKAGHSSKGLEKPG